MKPKVFLVVEGTATESSMLPHIVLATLHRPKAVKVMHQKKGRHYWSIPLDAAHG